MKLRTKIRAIAMPIAALSVVAAPICMATSCSQDYEKLFFTVTNNKGLEIEFCDTGASIANMKLGNTYLTYHPKDRAKYINHEGKTYFHGKLLGRVAGRFADGKVKIAGKDYQLQVNEKSATKNNCLHGGTNSLCYKDFTHKVDVGANFTTVTFTATSPDGEAGFPGELKVEVQYIVYMNENKIDTILKATPDRETLINLSTHSLFRLGNDGDVLDYKLTIPGANRVLYDKEDIMKTNQVPVGFKAVTEDNGYYNFNNPKRIGDDIYASAVRDPISNGYDHIWSVADVAKDDRKVNLFNPKNGLNFEVQALSEKVTGFILYSNDYPMKGTIMSDGKEDALYAGITIEPYTYFDSKSLGNITYTPKNPFYTSYRYTITQKEPE